MEKQIESTLRDKIKKLGGIAIKLQGGSFTGLPDRLILLPGGRVSFVETKWSEKGPRPRQLAVHRLLESLGFKVYVVRDNDSLKNYLLTIDIL